MENVFEFLKKLGISYEVHNHQAVFTVEEARAHRVNADFAESKNLFLRNKKGDKHFLVTLSGEKQLDINKLGEILEENRLSFASPDRLKRYLDLTPGSVSPFGLINDVNKEVVFVVDNDLFTYEKQGLHPNNNTQTVVISSNDFKKYLDSIGNKVIYLDL